MVSSPKHFPPNKDRPVLAEQQQQLASSPALVSAHPILDKSLQDIQLFDTDDDEDNDDNAFVETVLDLTAPKEEPKDDDEWQVLPPSAKSLRTMNPIRAIVDPIVANIKSGEERGDGKNHISLGVSVVVGFSDVFLTLCCNPARPTTRVVFISITEIAFDSSYTRCSCLLCTYCFFKLGDPTAAGNLPPCPVALETILQTLSQSSSMSSNENHHHHHAAGYVNACGTLAAREAIARFHSPTSSFSGGSLPSVTADNVVVASGCSGALELVLTALLDNGGSSIDQRQQQPSILLVPQPGFPLYQVIAESHGAMVLHYRLLPDKNWEIDLDHVRELVQQHHHGAGATSSTRRVRGIIVNNPSNPTGAVYSSQHLSDIVDMVDDCRLPIVADEVYGDLVFGKHQFHPMADMAARAGSRVPVVTCSGLGKQYLIPGWRAGWAVFHDNMFGSLREVEAGTKRLAQVTMGASHLIQTVIPPLLDQAKQDSSSNGKQQDGGTVVQVWKRNLIHNLQEQAHFLEQQLSLAPGLHVMKAQGAMYCMIRFNPEDFAGHGGIQNDVDFCQLLLKEENVLVLPGSCFGASNAFRVVFCAPKTILKHAADRITAFCERHYQKK
jgi:tyrosine aminotransferase